MPGLLRSAERQIRRDILLILLAFVSIGIAVYELLDPDVSTSFTPLDAIDLAIVAVFILDFVVELRRAPDRRAYLKAHWWELPALIPITPGMVASLEGIGLVRGLRLVRAARLIRLVRLVGVAGRIRNATRFVARVADRAQLLKIAIAGAFVVLLGAGLIYVIERDVNPNVATLGGAFWFSLNIVTNVAYLDFQPATSWGYVVAGILEVSGMGFIGIFAGSLASAILSEPNAAEDVE